MVEGGDPTEQAIEQLELVLNAEELDEVDYHLRQALQLLGIRD